jgi:hypothetical protein
MENIKDLDLIFKQWNDAELDNIDIHFAINYMVVMYYNMLVYIAFIYNIYIIRLPYIAFLMSNKYILHLIMV